jgi:hypothetical protein
VREGLTRVEALKPGSGFAELLAGARGNGAGVAAFARGELGWRLTPSASLFGFGDAAVAPGTGPEWQAGVGFRATW